MALAIDAALIETLNEGYIDLKVARRVRAGVARNYLAASELPGIDWDDDVALAIVRGYLSGLATFASPLGLVWLRFDRELACFAREDVGHAMAVLAQHEKNDPLQLIGHLDPFVEMLDRFDEMIADLKAKLADDDR